MRSSRRRGFKRLPIQELRRDTALAVFQFHPLELRRLTQAEFQGLAQLPPEVTWFANIRNANTRRAYGGARARRGAPCSNVP